MSEQVRNDSRLAPSSLLLGKARERSLLSLNRKVVNFELFPSPRHSFQRLFFAPATGCRNESAGALNAVGARCYSWSSSPFSVTSSGGGRLWCTATDVHPLNNNNGLWASPCAASKHLCEVVFVAPETATFADPVKKIVFFRFGICIFDFYSYLCATLIRILPFGVRSVP